MEALSACALSTPEIQDKLPSGLLFIYFLCYVDICVARCVSSVSAVVCVCQYFDCLHAFPGKIKKKKGAMSTCGMISSGLNVFSPPRLPVSILDTARREKQEATRGFLTS